MWIRLRIHFVTSWKEKNEQTYHTCWKHRISEIRYINISYAGMQKIRQRVKIPTRKNKRVENNYSCYQN